jgi:thiamine-phosphate pyrophosphorylase
MIEEASRIKELCGDDAILIINDDVGVALAVNADGVHLGSDDVSYDAARERLGKDKIIGITTRNAEDAAKAESLGADYVSIGPIFSTTTKPDLKPVGIEMIEKVKNAVNIPFVAIGGINFDNLDSVIAAGAAKAAAISAVVAKDDVEKEVKGFIGRIRK